MRTVLLAVVLVALGAGAARAERTAPPASCFAHPERWGYDRDRDKEPLAVAGERFFEDMRACDSTFAAAIVESIRYQIQDEEARKFVHSRGFVIAAYGVAWAILAISGILLWMRQRKLTGEISSLEARLRAAEKT